MEATTRERQSRIKRTIITVVNPKSIALPHNLEMIYSYPIEVLIFFYYKQSRNLSLFQNQ